MDHKYWAFISYSSKDNRTGSWLHNRLENYPIPSDFRGQKLFDGAILGKNLRPVFRDRDELSGSSNLGEAIGEALEGSRFLIVLCSKNSAKSEWVNKEIESFNEMGKGDNILALILDGEPNATSKGRPEDECFPPALQYPAEPIAGDLRKEGDGKERGFLKVLAGITQLDFDQLYRRHERNMARRRRMIALAAGLLITIFAALAGYAFYQRGVAIESQKIAEENEKVAISAKNEAETQRNKAIEALEKAEKAEKAERVAKEEAKENEAIALRNEKIAEVERNKALEQEYEAKDKFRKLLFEKYESAKSLGAQEKALTYLSEVLRLTREEGQNDSDLISLLDLERTLEMEKRWDSGTTLPVLFGAVKRSGTEYLIRSDKDTLWLLKVDQNGQSAFKPLYPEFKNVHQVSKLKNNIDLVLNDGIIYRIDKNYKYKELLNLSNSTMAEWFYVAESTGHVLIYDNLKMYFYKYNSDKLILDYSIPIQARKDMKVFDFVCDNNEGIACLRVNESGQRKLLLVDLKSGNVIARHNRQGSWTPIQFINNQFVYTGGGGEDVNFTELIFIDRDNPKVDNRIYLPWDDPNICYRDDDTYYLITNQAMVYAMDKSGNLIEDLKLNPDSFWGEVNCRVHKFGDNLFISSENSFEAWNLKKSPYLIGQIENDVNKNVTLLAEDIILSFSDRKWSYINDETGQKINTTNCSGVLANRGDKTFFWWKDRKGYIESVYNDSVEYDLIPGKPKYFFPDKRILVMEKMDILYFYNLEDSEISEVLSTDIKPFEITTIDGEIYCINKNGEALEFYHVNTSLEKIDKPILFKTSFKGSAIPDLTSNEDAIIWRNAESEVITLKLDMTEIKNGEFTRYSLPNTSPKLIAVDHEHFALSYSNGEIELYNKGILVRGFSLFSESKLAKLVNIKDDNWITLSESGTVSSLKLHLRENEKSFGSDFSRLNGPLYEAVRAGSYIDVRWHNGSRSRLLAPGVGVEKYYYMTQSNSQKYVAAVDDNFNEIILWGMDEKSEISANDIYGYDISYGGLWFIGDDLLVAGITNGALVFRIEDLTLKLISKIDIPEINRVEIFHSAGDDFYFGEYDTRAFCKYNISDDSYDIFYGLDSINSLYATEDSLYIGLAGSVDLFNPVTKEFDKRFFYPSGKDLYWKIRELLIIEDKNLLVMDHGPKLVFFDLDSTKWLGEFEMPENPHIKSYDMDDGIIYLGGTHFSSEFIFKKTLTGVIEDYMKDLPYTINGSELYVRNSPIYINKGDSNE